MMISGGLARSVLRRTIHSPIKVLCTSFHSSSWRCQKMEWENTKELTGLEGLPVIPNARDVLISIYNNTIEKAKSYENVGYNRLIIRLCKFRMNIVKTARTISDVEKQIRCGQIEELIDQAEDELELLVELNEHTDPKPWEESPLADETFDNYTWPNGITLEMVQEQQNETVEDILAEIKEKGIKMPDQFPQDLFRDLEE